MSYKKSKVPFAKKSFGQNFLVDEKYIDKIIGALDLQPGELVIEIGPGRGSLTEKLIASGARIVAIEIEREMIRVLKEDFGHHENFKLIEADALKVDFRELVNPINSDDPPKTAKLVANLPYYISTAILQKLIEQRTVFSEMILMFQREVVERITAPAGNKERGFLTVLVERYLETAKLFEVPPSAFRPAPKVWSAIMRLITKSDGGNGKENIAEKTENTEADEKLFRQIVSAAFVQKRKTILNNLKNAPPDLRAKIGDAEEFLTKSGIVANRRAETLDFEEWKQLFAALN